jgi:hypothetical protein
MTTAILTPSVHSSDLWTHPTLALFTSPETLPAHRAYLYSNPSLFGESYDSDDLPQPTSAQDLPRLSNWLPVLAVSILEIWAGKRQPMQIVDRCHRVIYLEILKRMGSLKEVGTVRRFHITEPLDGICEASIGVQFKERYRCMVMRVEGVDGRWLCTEVDLL